jgi:hypothetical protein
MFPEIKVIILVCSAIAAGFVFKNSEFYILFYGFFQTFIVYIFLVLTCSIIATSLIMKN